MHKPVETGGGGRLKVIEEAWPGLHPTLILFNKLIRKGTLTKMTSRKRLKGKSINRNHCGLQSQVDGFHYLCQ